MPLFHSTTIDFSVWFFKYIYIFFHSGHRSYCRYYIWSRINNDCVFLASHNDRHNHIHSNRKWLNSLKVIFTKKLLTESSHFSAFWCIPCTTTPSLISSKNVNNTACVSRLSFSFFWLWFNISCLMQIL